MGRKYENAPIIEAVCEFQFPPSSEWDPTVYGLVFEQVKGRFPKKRKTRQLAVSLSPEQEGVRRQVQASDRLQFLSVDDKALVQVGENLLAVNRLKPYLSWQHFLPLIKEGFDAYCSSAKPKELQRIGLRYINRIELSGQRLELGDYFEFYPHVGPSLPQEHGPFLVGIQVPYARGRDLLKIELASVDAEQPEHQAMRLDLDYFLVRAGDVNIGQALGWVIEAHDRIEGAFEACIKDTLRERFREAVA